MRNTPHVSLHAHDEGLFLVNLARNFACDFESPGDDSNYDPALQPQSGPILTTRPPVI